MINQDFSLKKFIKAGDLDAAWASVVKCKRNYNIIPFRKGIARELIKREDTNKLQQLVDMSTDLYGEHNSLFDLACFFVDEERVKEAKRVLETPGLRVRSESVSEVCKYYLREKQTKRIEDLLAASAGTSIDRRFVYEYLLEAYMVTDCGRAHDDVVHGDVSITESKAGGRHTGTQHSTPVFYDRQEHVNLGLRVLVLSSVESMSEGGTKYYELRRPS
ncbi:hypothetical protein FHG87_016363 [Trinorchestia longiramus]|nr:hypothetical protein FHG87_016363 [Trinorchestia longiramus]